MRRGLLWCLVVLLAPACGSAAAAVNDAPRLALVIGNAAYRSDPLPTAANEAGLVAQSLAQIGFDVIAARDTDAATLRRTVSAFADQVRDAGPRAIVFVYLSGYGVQFAGANFVVPVDARMARQADVPSTAVPLAEIQTALEALPARARLFVYDLARENKGAIAEAVPLAGGLMLVRAPRGSLYAFNAAPGTVAIADLPPYGLYARALAEALRTPGLSVQAMFARVRLRMADVTSGATVPWDDADLDADLILLPPVSPTSSVAPKAIPSSIDGLPEDAAFWTAIAQDRLTTYMTFARAFASEGLAGRLKMMIAVRLEAATWSESVRVNRPAAYWSYMQRYPRGPHYVDVRRRLAAIHAALEPPMRFDPYVFADAPMPSPDQVRRVDRRNVTSDDPGGRPIPRVADELLPPAFAATDLDLPPPPLVPRGVLPIPMPLSPVATTAWRSTPGPIEQPFVPGQGLVTIESEAADDGTPVMSLSTEAGLITRTTVSLGKGQRTMLQTDAADEIISRTVVTRINGSFIGIAQTGPGGELLGKITTHVDPLGERLTTVSDGRDQLIGEVRADRRGVIKEITRGTAAWSDAAFVLPSLEALPQTPKVETPLAVMGQPAMPNAAVLPPMPAFESAPVPPAAPSAVKGASIAKSGDVGPPLVTPLPALPSVPVPTSHASPKVNPPAIVPLPVPRPPQAALRPRRAAVPGHIR